MNSAKRSSSNGGTSASGSRRGIVRRFRLWWAVAAICGSIIVYDGVAATADILGADIPILTAILGQEVKETLQMGVMLNQTMMLVKQVKEYATLTKTVYRAIDELRHMTWEDLQGYVTEGLKMAFPEVMEMYHDVKDIADLDQTNYRAQLTLRGLLWEYVYGPGIELLPGGQDRLETISTMEEYRGRKRAQLDAVRAEGRAWKEDAELGAGAAQAAANRAEIQQVLQLADISETALSLHEAQQKHLEREDRRDMADINMFERWMYDVGNFMIWASGNEDECYAGRCLYQRYGAELHARIRQYQQRYPQQFDTKFRSRDTDAMIPPEDDE